MGFFPPEIKMDKYVDRMKLSARRSETSFLERYYLPYLKKNASLLRIYRKGRDYWFANLGSKDLWQLWPHLFPLREEGKDGWSYPKSLSHKEAQDVLKVLDTEEPKARYSLLQLHPRRYTIYSCSVFIFVLDQADPMLSRILRECIAYYGRSIPENDEDFLNAVLWSLLMALIEHPRKSRGTYLLNLLRAGYKVNPDTPYFIRAYFDTFWIDVFQRFKEYFWIAIGSPRVLFSELDEPQFAKEFQQEWERAKAFSDINYGFSVIPVFTDDDAVRYANLPKRLQKGHILNEMIDYTVLRICPRFLPELDQIEDKRFQRWQRLLLGLTKPLVDTIVKYQENKKERKLAEEEEKKLRTDLEKKIFKIAAEEYNFLHKKKEYLEKIPGIWGIFPSGHLHELSTFAQDLREGKFPDLPPDALKCLIEKSKWVRPYHFLKQRLFKDFAPDFYLERKKGQETRFKRTQYSEEEEIGTGGATRKQKSCADLATTMSSFSEQLGAGGSLDEEPENLDGSQKRIPLQLFIDPETGEQFYFVSGVREKLGRSERTIKRMASRGELKCIWKRIGSKGRAVQLFPKKEIDGLQAPVYQKNIAERLGISARHWRRIRKKWGFDRASAEALGLSTLEQQKQLLDIVKLLVKEVKKQRNGS